MGKIRVKTLGDEAEEKQQLDETKKRHEAKKVEKQGKATETVEEAIVESESPAEVVEVKEVKKEKKLKFQKNGPARSNSYKKVAEKVDLNKTYTLKEAVTLLPELKRAKFDETVELHITFVEGSISGSTVLPHGTGKQTRVAIANGADEKALDALLKSIESGTIDFDVLIATPDAMPKLARAARILGPKGLMPNPKNGTVTPKAEEAAKKFEGGQINFKTEAKFPLLHVSIGKVSFGDDKIKDNAKAVFNAINAKKIKNATLKSTMSPAIRLDVTSL